MRTGFPKVAVAALICAGFLAGPSGAAEGDAIYAGGLGSDGLTARLPSNGCTGKASFTVQTGVRDGMTTLQLVRVRKDPCRAYLPAGVMLNWSRGELGLLPGQTAVLVNPHTDLLQ
jgi:hypothetical protein